MELPRVVAGLLDQESVALLAHLPENMRDRVLAFMIRAVNSSIPVKANRLVRYALVVAAVDSDIAEEVNAGEHERLERAELLLRVHGSEPDDNDDGKAAKLYAGGRAARQRIASSLTATAKRYQKSLEIIRREWPRLPVQVRRALPLQELELGYARLITAQRAAELPPDHQRNNRSERTMSRSQWILLLWEKLIPSYRTKWDDMLTLASFWRISAATDVHTLRTMVGRARKGQTTITLPPGTELLLIFAT